NIGGMAAPFDLKIIYEGGTTATIHKNSSIWKTNQQTAVITVPSKKIIQSIELAGGIYVDADSTNNNWKR
ncbi:MAG: hypothetical protein ABIU30_22965, partial [Ferruginibacter sp.]